VGTFETVVVRRERPRGKQTAFRPLRNALQVAWDDFSEKAPGLFRLIAIVYSILLGVAVPLTAVALIPITKNSSFIENVGFMTLELSKFVKFASGMTPGDYILAAIVLLYHRNVRTSLAFLLGGAFIFLFGNYCVDPILKLILSVGPTSNNGVALEFAFNALLLGIIITSLFLPTIVAYKNKRTSFIKYLLLNMAIGWIPPAWVVLIFFAFKPAKSNKTASNQGSQTVQESKSVEVEKPSAPAVHSNKRKKKKGFKRK
jgi:hypothetical protein